MNTIPGYMTEKECHILRELFTEYNSKTCIGVEIGSFLGRSSWEISHSIPLGKLYCVDKWNNWEVSEASYDNRYPNKPINGTICSLDTFLQNTKDCINITTIQASDPTDMLNWNQQIDFLFLDAAHTNPSDKEWIDYWLPKIKSGGKIAGHDFNMGDLNRFPDVYMNIKFLQTILNQRVQLTRTAEYNSTIWYFDI